MISAYWKTIDTTDPYKKDYLIKLASDELEDYKRKNDKYEKAVKKADGKANAKRLQLTKAEAEARRSMQNGRAS